MTIECPPASVNPSSQPMGVSKTYLQMASTSSAPIPSPASASVGVASPGSVRPALGGVFKSPWTKQETWTLSVWHTEDDAKRYVDNFEEFAAAVSQ